MRRDAEGRTSLGLRLLTPVLVVALGASLAVVAATKPSPVRAAEPVCTISAKLVNSCRPWLGAESGGYSGSGFRGRMLEHETRIGRQLDIVHAYLGETATSLSSDMITLAKRPATIGLYNWRVSLNWAAGGGSNNTVNARIDAMAASIKALGSSQIMLTIYHEPEGSISAGGSPSCPAMHLTGASGSTADYVNMWHNVRQRFDALGVSNVVWVMNYTGYLTGQCLTKDLWPGNDFVDWVMWDPYPKNNSWTATVNSFYNYLTANSDADHDFLSKPWGLAEFGYVGSSQNAAYTMYDDAARAIANNTHPKLKAYVVWDNYTSSSHDDRVRYTETHVVDPVEQEHYNALVDSPSLNGTAIPEPTDQAVPTVVRTAPDDGATVDGVVTATGTASDNVEVESVQLLVDDDPVGTATPDGDGSVAIDWNSATVTNGTHTLRLWARDTSGNTAVSDPATVTVENFDEEPPTPPTGLTATWSRPSKVTLEWSAASDNGAVTGYRVYRDGDLATTLGHASLQYADLDAEDLATHHYVVTALDAAGNESEPSEEVEVETQDGTAPTAVAAEAELTAPDEATVTWDEATDNDAVAGYRVYRNDALLADVTDGSRTLVDDGLDDGLTYSYRVTAYDAAGNTSENGDPAYVTTPDTTAPTTPLDLKAVSAPQSVALTWKPSTDNVGVTNYVVYRDSLPVMTLGPTATGWTDSAPIGSTLHRYQVAARDLVEHESGKSNEVARTIDGTAPTIPLNLRATSSSQSVALAWSASTDNVGVTNYIVYRDGLPRVTLASTATSWTDSALVGSTLHRYRVTARDATGNESAKSNEVARTLADTTAPTAPTRLARTLSGFTVRLTWTAATDNVGVVGYTIYRGGVAIGTSTTPAYTDAAAPLGKTSIYTVRARDAAGNVGAASTALSVAVPADKTAPSTPTGLRATVGAAGTRQITMSWNASTDNVGVTNYYLYRGNAKYKLLGKVTSYVDTGLKAGTKYTYKVYALDAAANWSGASGNVSATAR